MNKIDEMQHFRSRAAMDKWDAKRKQDFQVFITTRIKLF